jgi:hypothetical protein
MDPETQRLAQAKAAELGISFAEYIRRLVAADLGGPKRRIDMSTFFDLGSSGEATDVAREKDQMLGRAVRGQYSRKTGAMCRKPSAKRRKRERLRRRL